MPSGKLRRFNHKGDNDPRYAPSAEWLMTDGSNAIQFNPNQCVGELVD